MRLRLSYKILAAFFLLNVFSVVLAVGILRYFAISHFRQYIREKDLEWVQALLPEVSELYAESGGWAQLEGNRRMWYRMLRSHRIDRHPSQRSPHKGEGMPPGDIPAKPIPPEPEDKDAPPRPKISLFDADRRHLVGPPGPPSAFTMKPVVVDGRTVGWIGLREFPRLSHPMELDFIQRQFRVFYIVGGVMLLLSAVVAVLLSKNLLGPVRRLADGTRNLAQRRFDTRIAVQSSDELGQLARDFNAMAEQLDNYEHRQKQWLSDISHELRTPLSVIIGEIEALQDGVRVADDRALASLYTEASHIRKIVSDLHDLSFAEAGAMSLNLQPIEPLTVLKEVATLFRDRGRSEGLDVVEAFASAAGLQIAGDRDRLRQVFTNICENAFQYTEKPGTLTIESESTGRAVRIVFEDTGPGVPPAVLPRLFDRLYRVDASRDRATGGSGLGLSICKGIIENHGGTIRAAAGRRGGLRIEIELPTG